MMKNEQLVYGETILYLVFRKGYTIHGMDQIFKTCNEGHVLAPPLPPPKKKSDIFKLSKQF